MAKIDVFWAKNRSNWRLFCVIHLCLAWRKGAWKKAVMTFVIIGDHFVVISSGLIVFFDHNIILHENPSKCDIHLGVFDDFHRLLSQDLIDRFL
jgi:hypothetical protein